VGISALKHCAASNLNFFILLIYLGKKMAERDSSGSTTVKQATSGQATPQQATSGQATPQQATQVVGSAIPKRKVPRLTPPGTAAPLGTATPKKQAEETSVTSEKHVEAKFASPIDFDERLFKAVLEFILNTGGETHNTVSPGTMKMALVLQLAMVAVTAVAAQPASEATEINYVEITAKLAALINAMLRDDRCCVYLNNACAFAFNTFVRLVKHEIEDQRIFEIIENPENVERPRSGECKEKQYNCIRTVFTYIAPFILKNMKSVSQ